jgi:hypothetical protein
MLSSNRFLNDLMHEVAAHEAAAAPPDPLVPSRDTDGRFATDSAKQSQAEFRATLRKLGVTA